LALVGKIGVVVVVVVVGLVSFEAFVVVVFGAGTAAEGSFVGVVVAGKGIEPAVVEFTIHRLGRGGDSG
jgi:hypothetical protein